MALRGSRWKIIALKEKENKVFVKDHLFNKVRVYMVPNLSAAHLDKNHLKVNTHTGKLMSIELPSGSRRFLPD